MSGRDINIMGEGSVSGGQYTKIRVFGDANFLDGVEAESVSVFGTARLHEVNAGEIKVSGTADFRGNVKAGAIRVNGTADFCQRVKTDSIVVNGAIRAEQGLESERFISRGSFEADNLNVNDIEMYLGGPCRVKEIGAENVRVYSKVWYAFLHDLFRPHFQQLEVDTIEADRIYLEKTVAQSVKGNQITIGPGCRIKLVEFKESVSIDRDAQVEKTVQI